VSLGGQRATVAGATGLIGPRLVAALRDRGAEVTVLTRDPQRAHRVLGDVDAVAWDAAAEPAPAAALDGRAVVFNLAGAPIQQRWSKRAKRAIRASRVHGTENLVAALARLERRPAVLVNSSAVGYYGAHGEEPLDEDAPPGRDFLAQVCADWEGRAAAAAAAGIRPVMVRTGVVLDRRGGALAAMLKPFRLGLGGPVAGGHQFISWVHVDDVVAVMLAAAEDEAWSGPVNATAPEPVTNTEFSRELGRALGRPAVLPVPGFAMRALYGEMAQVVTTGARVVPARPLMLGYEFAHPRLADALRAALAS
jgi:uncharacterized protein (TIGR01777 family)